MKDENEFTVNELSYLWRAANAMKQCFQSGNLNATEVIKAWNEVFADETDNLQMTIVYSSLEIRLSDLLRNIYYKKINFKPPSWEIKEDVGADLTKQQKAVYKKYHEAWERFRKEQMKDGKPKAI